MANQTTTRTLLIAAALAATASAVAHAAEPDMYRTPVISVVGSEASSRQVSLGVGKAVVIDLPRDTKDVLVADPTIANAVVRSARRAYMIGVKVGQTSIFFFDAEGRQIAGFDLVSARRSGRRYRVPTSRSSRSALRVSFCVALPRLPPRRKPRSKSQAGCSTRAPTEWSARATRSSTRSS
jgi:Flp pilus assembly secretin CpaC